MRKLGENQKGVLESLKFHGYWSEVGFCGWNWDTHSNTKKILDSLVKRGLVELNDHKYTIRTDRTDLLDDLKFMDKVLVTKNNP